PIGSPGPGRAGVCLRALSQGTSAESGSRAGDTQTTATEAGAGAATTADLSTYGPAKHRPGATGTGTVPAGRGPRIARLMALALRFEQLLRAGEIKNYTHLARLGHVSRARISQIMRLTLLSSAIQEALLFLPRTLSGRNPIHLRQLLSVAAVMDWRQQPLLWKELEEPSKSMSRLWPGWPSSTGVRPTSSSSKRSGPICIT